MDGFFAALERVEARWPAGTASVTVPTAYGTTRVLTRHASGTPVLLIPGGGATGASWLTLAHLLPEHDLYAVDVIGDAGRSQPTNGRLRTAAQVAQWLEETVDGLGLVGDVVLVGHSYGGWLALTYALHHPRRVRSLALVAPTRCFAGMSARYLWRAAPLLLKPSPDQARSLLEWETGAIGVDEELIALNAEGMGRRWAGIATPKLPKVSLIERLPMPIDLVLAEHDRSHDNAACERRAARAANVRVTTVPDTTHHSVTDVGAPTIAARVGRVR